MCGIIGIFNEPRANEKIKLALELLERRGKDGFGVASEKEVVVNKDFSKLIIPATKNLLGHTLHSVVDFVPQPLKGKGTLVANCEIYNWKELFLKYNLSAKNDAELLVHLLDRFGVKEELLNELDGVYAFAYWKKQKVYLVRDSLGVKPLWFALEKGKFSFASEKKVLVKLGFNEVQELNPRQVLEYTINTKKARVTLRPFFRYTPELTESKDLILKNLGKLLSKAVEKRVPERKFGVLFSGGIDSVFLAHTLKKMGANFTCYTAVMEEKEGASPSDLIAAEKVAKEFEFKLKVRKVKLEEIHGYLSKVVPLIEDSNVVKAAVALTLYFACEMAKKDGCKVIFSGLGSEEIFAGYERHKRSTNLNAECLAGLRKLYERDLYRDDVVSMAHGLELRLPFLDKALAGYALRIPEKYKLSEAEGGKLIFRELALRRGIPQEWAFRKKIAAQYGSRMDWAIDKVAKQQGFISKSAYLRKFYAPPNLKLGVLFSSGKDSTYASQVMQRQNYELSCLITVKSKNPDSYMFHTPAVELVKLQAKAMGLPLVLQETKGEKEVELGDLRQALVKAKRKYGIEGIITGALYSTYQRDRIEEVADSLGLKIFSPLWHKPQEQEMMELLAQGYEIVIVSISADGMKESWLGQRIDKNMILELIKLKEKTGINVAFEGGEAESLVLDCPLFRKKIEILDSYKVMDSPYSGKLIIKKAKLVTKN